MATTTTTLSGAITATGNGAQRITLAAFTNPATGAIPEPVLGQCEDELMLVTDATYSPTISVVRGYMGTVAVAHSNLTGFKYGTAKDMQASAGIVSPFASLAYPWMLLNSIEITATGATGSAGAVIDVPVPAFLSVTGASGAGINLPVPQSGAAILGIVNKGTGAINLYCVGGTINGTTGTTAYAITATGNLWAEAFCATSGAWTIRGNT